MPCNCQTPCGCVKTQPTKSFIKWTDTLNFLVGYNDCGETFALRSQPGSVAVAGSDGIKMRTGAAGDQISTPLMMESPDPAKGIMALDTTGRWYQLTPDEKDAATYGKMTLVSESGEFFWEPIGESRTEFSRALIKDTDCDFSFAGLQECGGGKTSKLVRITPPNLRRVLWDATEMPETSDDCISGIVVIQAGKLVVLKPDKDKALVAREVNGVACWQLEDKPKTTSTGAKMMFKATGTIQTFTVPAGATGIKGWLWGAMSGEDTWNGTAPRYGGGFTMFTISATPGDQYAVLVGKMGDRSGNNAFGFGGKQGPQQNASGGGGTFLLTGLTMPVNTDLSRVVAAAGGGAGIGRINDTFYNELNNGGNAKAGSFQATMSGQDGTGVADGNGAGGGGYNGGSLNVGGKGYVIPAAISASMETGLRDSQAGTSDPNYASQGGDGYAVFEFLFTT